MIRTTDTVTASTEPPPEVGGIPRPEPPSEVEGIPRQLFESSRVYNIKILSRFILLQSWHGHYSNRLATYNSVDTYAVLVDTYAVLVDIYAVLVATSDGWNISKRPIFVSNNHSCALDKYYIRCRKC